MKRTADLKMSLPNLHVRSDLHLARKTWHMVMGMVIAFVYLAGMPAGTAALILSSVLGLALFIETTRLQFPAFNEKVMRFWAPIMRAHEAHRMSAVPHYLLACVLAIAIFPKPV